MATNSEGRVNTPFERSNTSNTSPECGLEDAIELLREDVEVRAEWREQLLREVAAEPQPARRTRTWQLSPITAMAAALACMIAGGGITSMWQAREASKNTDSTGASLTTAAAQAALSDSAIGVRFAIMAQGARQVSLVGDFNNWNPDVTPLRLANDGRTWVATLPLRSGRHTYAFVIDGDVVADPSAPRAADDDFGTPSSIVLVSASR